MARRVATDDDEPDDEDEDWSNGDDLEYVPDEGDDDPTIPPHCQKLVSTKRAVPTLWKYISAEDVPTTRKPCDHHRRSLPAGGHLWIRASQTYRHRPSVTASSPCGSLLRRPRLGCADRFAEPPRLTGHPSCSTE